MDHTQPQPTKGLARSQGRMKRWTDRSTRLAPTQGRSGSYRSHNMDVDTNQGSVEEMISEVREATTTVNVVPISKSAKALIDATGTAISEQ